MQAAYADRVECEKLRLTRARPFIKEIEFEHLRVLEKFEQSKGQFGTLNIVEDKGMEQVPTESFRGLLKGLLYISLYMCLQMFV